MFRGIRKRLSEPVRQWFTFPISEVILRDICRRFKAFQREYNKKLQKAATASRNQSIFKKQTAVIANKSQSIFEKQSPCIKNDLSLNAAFKELYLLNFRRKDRHQFQLLPPAL